MDGVADISRCGGAHAVSWKRWKERLFGIQLPEKTSDVTSETSEG